MSKDWGLLAFGFSTTNFPYLGLELLAPFLPPLLLSGSPVKSQVTEEGLLLQQVMTEGSEPCFGFIPRRALLPDNEDNRAVRERRCQARGWGLGPALLSRKGRIVTDPRSFHELWP